jgi:hypothetical protein
MGSVWMCCAHRFIRKSQHKIQNPNLASPSSQRKLGSSDFLHPEQSRWIPAFAGMTADGQCMDVLCHRLIRKSQRKIQNTNPASPSSQRKLGSSDFLHSEQRRWIPAFARMTADGQCMDVLCPPLHSKKASTKSRTPTSPHRHPSESWDPVTYYIRSKDAGSQLSLGRRWMGSAWKCCTNHSIHT